MKTRKELEQARHESALLESADLLTEVRRKMLLVRLLVEKLVSEMTESEGMLAEPIVTLICAVEEEVMNAWQAVDAAQGRLRSAAERDADEER